jgi:hypothetical protein
MPFVDGEPIDAAKLGALETELNLLRSQMPKISSGQSINIDNRTQAATNPTASSGPTIFAKNDTTRFDLVPGVVNRKTISLQGAGFKSTPVIVVSTRSAEGNSNQWHPAFRVVSNTVSTTSFDVFCPMPGTAKACSVFLSFIAIAP